uniref:Uncharacterized protein n=1 Tax=Panthera tigris altaica TaxID=74533 RepID=A0A8C9KNY0_PANTA
PLKIQQRLSTALRRRPNLLGCMVGRPLPPATPSSGALGSLCRHFQRRLPLRAVSRNLNLGAGPSWKRLENPEPAQQGLQAAARSAKNALGSVSQVMPTALNPGLPRCPQPWRSRREPTFRSPYSSTEPLCSPSESDSDPEPVGAGLQHLQKLSRQLDEAVVAEESGDMTMTVSLIRD